MAYHPFEDLDFTSFAAIDKDDPVDPWRGYDDHMQEEPNCGACADSRHVPVRWPRLLRWFRPNHLWCCPWCNPTRFDQALWAVMNPIWRARTWYFLAVDRRKSNNEPPF